MFGVEGRPILGHKVETFYLFPIVFTLGVGSVIVNNKFWSVAGYPIVRFDEVLLVSYDNASTDT
jgi:hypothetical protein